MNTRLFFFATSLFFFFGTIATAQKTIFVKPSAQPGDGSSWATAMNDLQAALRRASNGTQIWVAEGIYTPTETRERHISFEIPSGVKMFGGFAGMEKSADERKIESHPTILSGNIGSNDPEDNSYNVIYTHFVSAATRVDGFVISGGYANGDSKTSNRRRSGGGWYNDGANKGQSNPTISNCQFVENFAKDGGAFYNNGKDGEALPVFEACLFDSNSSDLDGGAVNNDGRDNGKAGSKFTNCQFQNNKGNYGGAVFNYGLHGQANANFSDCYFSENNAYVKGGAIFHLSDKALDRKMFGNSIFSNNSALDHDSDDVHHLLIGESQMAAN